MNQSQKKAPSIREEKKMNRAIEYKARHFARLDREILVEEARKLFADHYKLQLQVTEQKKEIAELKFQLDKMKVLKTRQDANRIALGNMPRGKRIKEIIRRNKKAMTTRDVWDVFRETENVNWGDPLKVMTTLLSRLVNSNELSCEHGTGRGYYYGLLEWFDERGKIKRRIGV